MSRPTVALAAGLLTLTLAGCTSQPASSASGSVPANTAAGDYALTFEQEYPQLSNDSGVGARLREQTFPAHGFVELIFRVDDEGTISAIAGRTTERSGPIFSSTSWVRGDGGDKQAPFVLREWLRCETANDEPPVALTVEQLVSDAIGPRNPDARAEGVTQEGSSRRWTVDDGIVILRIDENVETGWPSRTVEAQREDGTTAFRISNVELKPASVTPLDRITEDEVAYEQTCDGAASEQGSPGAGEFVPLQQG